MPTFVVIDDRLPNRPPQVLKVATLHPGVKPPEKDEHEWYEGQPYIYQDDSIVTCPNCERRIRKNVRHKCKN